MAKDIKTNAMRILDKAKISYRTHFYEYSDGKIDGISVAHKLHQNVDAVFKTLVTKGAGRDYYVFVLPVMKELNLKAAAKFVGEKSVEMIRVDEINKVTGYIRGGCSPIGMKKQYPTVLDDSCRKLDSILVSGGKIGTQVELSPSDLLTLIGATTGTIAVEPEKEKLFDY